MKTVMLDMVEGDQPRGTQQEDGPMTQRISAAVHRQRLSTLQLA